MFLLQIFQRKWPCSKLNGVLNLVLGCNLYKSTIFPFLEHVAKHIIDASSRLIFKKVLGFLPRIQFGMIWYYELMNLIFVKLFTGRRVIERISVL